MRRNGFLTFCFSFVPGCGQMYQGYMRRGISLLGWFCLVIFLAMVLGMGTLSIFLLAIWAYSFFDSFNIRALPDEQRANFRDDYMPNAAFLKKVSGGKLQLEGKGGRILGWVFIAIGGLLLYDNFLRPVLDQIAFYFPPVSFILYNIPALLLALGAIVAGIWILARVRGNQSKDDFIPYSGEENNNEA